MLIQPERKTVERLSSLKIFNKDMEQDSITEMSHTLESRAERRKSKEIFADRINVGGDMYPMDIKFTYKKETQK